MRRILGLWTTCIVALAICVTARATAVQIIFNDKPLAIQSGPILSNGELMVPLSLAEATGVTVHVSARALALAWAGKHASLTVDSLSANVNGKQIHLAAAPTRGDDRLWIPLAFLADFAQLTLHFQADPPALKLMRVAAQPQSLAAAAPKANPTRGPITGRQASFVSTMPATLAATPAHPQLPRPVVSAPRASSPTEAAPSSGNALALGAPWPVLGASFPTVAEVATPPSRPSGAAPAAAIGGKSQPSSGASDVSVEQQHHAAAGVRLLNFSAVSQGGIPRLSFEADGFLPASAIALSDPPRIRFDLYGVTLATSLLGVTEHPGGPFASIRFEQVTPGIARVTADLRESLIPLRVVDDTTGASHQVSFALLRPIKDLAIKLVPTGIAITGVPASLTPQVSRTADDALQIILPGITTPVPLPDRAPVGGPIFSVRPRNEAEGLTIEVGLRTPSSYQLVHRGSEFQLMLEAPDLSGRVILLDPGHGGSDPGAINGDLLEKDLNLDVAKRLGGLLQAAGARVEYTREDDTFVGLDARWQLNNRLHPDAFISIHTNSAQSDDASGTETYYSDRVDLPGISRTVVDRVVSGSRALAEHVQAALAGSVSLPDRGVKIDHLLWVLHHDTNPAILVEMPFIVNPANAKLLSQPTFRQKIAQAIFAGVVGYFKDDASGDGAKATQGTH